VARRGIFVAPFEGLSEPRLVADLAVLAELRGWDGFFVWDHIVYSPPTERVADPWVVLSAVAMATSRLRIGPMVTPVSRRRVQKLARETVSLDRLSGGRLVLGVGLGSDRHGELGPFGEVEEPRERAKLLDAGLERLAAYWGGEFLPPPFQQPRIPVWVATRYPSKKPLERAARWDGVFPIDLPGPEVLAEYVAGLPTNGQYEVVVEHEPGADCAPWVEAGATWCLTSFGQPPTEAEARAAIEAGP
jgi:alkanesulfonate monooxygenase SsuD/methylene tetrahydromethanopterin reductase-like flavin-dependent oxidoreductase (luciferase family)